MIVEISFGLEHKIPNLTAARIHVPCDCKVMKIGGETDKFDCLMDLCPIHETKFKRIASGKIPSQVLIPGLKIDQENRS